MNIRAYVLNHYSRDPQKVVDGIRANGYEPVVQRDMSDFYKTRDALKWKGVYDNYRRILIQIMMQSEDWAVVLHDDVTVPPNLFDRINYVLHYAHPGMVSFYNPQNGPFLKAAAEGRHVLSTYTNYWTQCFCFHRDVVKPLYDWGTAHVNEDAPPPEDGYLWRYCSREQIPVSVIVPSLIQHEGFAESTHKIPAKVGRFERRSGTYDPNFDVTSVDWVKEFANPVWDGARKMNLKGLREDSF